jgi:poly(hydroxyalkanoate) depolymerase family esterase
LKLLKPPRFRTARWRRAVQRLGAAATRWMSDSLSLAVPATPSMPAPPIVGIRGGIAEVTHFGSNPGQLRMLVYHPPARPAPGAPLIVVLHGCRQEAAAFAAESGWIALARRLSIPLVLPEQQAANHSHSCFQWYRRQHVGRGRGEAMSIRQMVRHASQEFGSDRRRVFIVGLSAGGAMAAAMLAAYPAAFAAGAVVAGLPVGSASSTAMAMLRMRRANPFTTRAGLAAAVRAQASPRPSQTWPRLSIWQGGRDQVVDPGNAEQLAMQWAELQGCPEAPAEDTHPSPQVRHRVWLARGGPAVELWTLAEMGHGFPIALGCGSPAPWVLEAGVPAARHIAAFWELGEA